MIPYQFHALPLLTVSISCTEVHERVTSLVTFLALYGNVIPAYGDTHCIRVTCFQDVGQSTCLLPDPRTDKSFTQESPLSGYPFVHTCLISLIGSVPALRELISKVRCLLTIPVCRASHQKERSPYVLLLTKIFFFHNRINLTHVD